MTIYPAIDIKDGQCVRLSQGKFDDVTIFHSDPATVAKQWQDAGASFIHVVDLDGARFGSSHSNQAIASILNAVTIPIQVGGGIRTMDDINAKINMGVSRVILGTVSVQNGAFVAQAVKEHGNKIAVGVDASNGKVAIEGWTTLSDVDALTLCLDMKALGVATIIYTDIAKDGMMAGPNLETTKEIIDATQMDIIASGGVCAMGHLDACKAMGAHGAIIGKALYNGTLDLAQVIAQFS